ncbi:adenylate/guanylate cyclase domain-containing protein [Duganella callida]|uniref:Adenylate/guanylate cyclase domain-containing protein n=2 Tax=Duganella callida TaxID=2561932 RepID=A0A4Y9SND5_9BURK|nr:adenylate/guanylate cyclase domain-containing protein [Duganella callida]
MQNIAAARLRSQAGDLNSMISSIRGYYGSAVVGRILENHGKDTQVIHNYETVAGAIPIPATLSLELGRVIADKQSNVSYRFVSDYPFRGRAPHVLDSFEQQSLASLRAHPEQPPLILAGTSGTASQVRLIAPVLMSAACVACHNSHPDSPKKDWKIGDVRGLQEIEIHDEVGTSLWSFKYSLAYFLLAAATGLGFILLQRRQNALIRGMNADLADANDFLASVSMKISHYLSPQIYKNIFSGEMEVALRTQRKKLTIFFSDIKDFTALTESLQPEALTELVNDYFTAMSAIAIRHGGTIDKFIGDALLIFFGDPDTRGSTDDARNCLRMAVEMQHALAELNVRWRKRGLEAPLRVRMGINTGYCNVGNFGSSDRMDYTILGAEANLAARLQAIAPAGGIVVSYETYALVRDIVAGHALAPVHMKGIAREVAPYAIDGLLDQDGRAMQVFSEHGAGHDVFLDVGRIDAAAARSLRGVLHQAISALERKV